METFTVQSVFCLVPPLLIDYRAGKKNVRKEISNVNLCGDLGCFLIYTPCCVDEDEFPKGYVNCSHHNAVFMVLFHKKYTGMGVCWGWNGKKTGELGHRWKPCIYTVYIYVISIYIMHVLSAGLR